MSGAAVHGQQAACRKVTPWAGTSTDISHRQRHVVSTTEKFESAEIDMQTGSGRRSMPAASFTAKSRQLHPGRSAKAHGHDAGPGARIDPQTRRGKPDRSISTELCHTRLSPPLKFTTAEAAYAHQVSTMAGSPPAARARSSRFCSSLFGGASGLHVSVSRTAFADPHCPIPTRLAGARLRHCQHRSPGMVSAYTPLSPNQRPH